MKLAASLAASLALGLIAPAGAADSFQFDPSHTQILFEYDHLGFSTTQGTFTDWQGTLSVDEAEPANSRLSVTIVADSLHTGWADRDAHLRSADFFDVATYPTVTFASTAVERTGDETLTVAGEMTIRGTTQPVVFAVEVNGLADHPMTGVRTLGFTATTQVSRSAFGLGLFAPAVGDAVTIRVSGEATLAETDRDS
ncbi:MAG: YceI family protein [Alphaproteobacteria bacterium]